MTPTIASQVFRGLINYSQEDVDITLPENYATHVGSDGYVTYHLYDKDGKIGEASFHIESRDCNFLFSTPVLNHDTLMLKSYLEHNGVQAYLISYPSL